MSEVLRIRYAHPSLSALDPRRSKFYRPAVDARHWTKAALVVRIIFHPSASRFAISCPLRAVIPHATLRARQAFRIVWKACSTSGELLSTPRYWWRSPPAPTKIAPTPGTDAIASAFFKPSVVSIIMMANRSPSGFNGQRSARRSYSAAETPHDHTAIPGE